MSAEPVTIDVISDVVCPWCYLGKRRLARAIGLLPEIQFVVRWRPFRLDPTIPPEGVAREDYLTAKFGSIEALDESHRQLTERGREEGIDYRFDRITRSPNTVDAHRLVRWAGAEGVQDDMVERLFAAYFSEGLDIGDPAVLAALSEDVGFDAADHRSAPCRRRRPRHDRGGDRERLPHRRLGRALLHHRPPPGGDRGASGRRAGAGDRAGRRRARCRAIGRRRG